MASAARRGDRVLTADYAGATSATTGNFSVSVVLNGTELGVGEANLSATPNSITCSYTTVAKLAAGDRLSCHPAQTTGAVQNVTAGHLGRNVFSAARLY